MDLTQPTARKLLLVASTGGHLAQLVRLAPGLGAAPDSLWVTFDSPQSRSLLQGCRRVYVPYVRPRDYRGVLRTASIIHRILAHERFDGAVSTGAAVAVSALPQAAMAGIPSVYIESVSRVEGPSVSGRILAASHMVTLRTQHDAWKHGRWELYPSVLSTYVSVPRGAAVHPKLFVTLGTIEGYRFDALIDAVLATGLADESTIWQLGYTSGRRNLPGTVFEHMDAAQFAAASREADVVVTHAGVGSILGFLESGIYPVVVTRRKARHEHVDDHQLQIAQLAANLHVAESVDAPDLTAAVILSAAGKAIDTGSLPTITRAQ
ncbi:MAG: glycosyltransferase [Cryobacterium sp.]|jgi:UDP-N-acetylglucosamine transferase subunit ALG13|nr:glycosyltransferase [Cryobacterium sp.]